MKKKTPQWLIQNTLQLNADSQLKQQFGKLIHQLRTVIQQSKRKMHKLHSAYKNRQSLEHMLNSSANLRKRNDSIAKAVCQKKQTFYDCNLDVLYQIKHEKTENLNKIKEIEGVHLIIKRKEAEQDQARTYLQFLANHKIQLEIKISDKHQSKQLQKMKNQQLKNACFAIQSLISAVESKNSRLYDQIQFNKTEINRNQLMKNEAIGQQQKTGKQSSQIVQKCNQTKQQRKEKQLSIERTNQQCEKFKEMIQQELKRKQELEQKIKIYQYRVSKFKQIHNSLLKTCEKQQTAYQEYYETVKRQNFWIENSRDALNYQLQHAQKMLLRNYF